MKYNSLILFAALLFAACSHSQENTLLAQLQQAAQSGKFYYGHQDTYMYGHTWHVSADDTTFERSDVHDVCGQYPALLGYDLGEVELGGECNLDGNSFVQMRQAAIIHNQRGGLLTFSWHPRNPLTGGDAWDVSSNQVVASILPGGENHDKFMTEWLQRAADYLETFDFPILFRPWHENSGSWFWWGAGLCTPEQYKQLWAMTYDYFVNERGLTNLVWAYSPGSVKDAEEYMVTYPGDERVDIMGFDTYDSVPGFVERMHKQLDIVGKLSQEHGKVLAVSETGSESIKNPKWWTEQLLPAVEGYPVAYVLTWRNAWDKPEHFYGPWKGAACEQDFVEFCNNERTIFVK